MVHALGIAGSQSAGTFAQIGTPTIKFAQARAAFSGLIAADLAARGFTAAEEILLHPDGGLYFTHSDGGQPDTVTEDLGSRWELENISLRPWPVGAYLQGLVSALLPLAVEQRLTPAVVRRLEVRLSREAFRLHGRLGADDTFTAKVSARHLAAVLVRDQRCWLDQFDDAAVADAGLAEFARSRIDIVEQDDAPEHGAVVHVELNDGRMLERTSRVPHGDATDPLRRDEIIGKLDAAAIGVITPAAVSRIVDSVTHLEDRRSASELFRALTPGGTGL
jgi:2-methylcitrate dehydratase PrpD